MDLVWMKVVSTAACIALVVSSVISIFSLYYVRAWLAKEQIAAAEGRVPGRKVIAYMERHSRFSEEGYLAFVRCAAPIAQLAAAFGWLCGIALLLGAIWS
jgi:hypothetical protein